MNAREGAALVAEQERLVIEFDRTVAKITGGSGVQTSPVEHWHDMRPSASPTLSPCAPTCARNNVTLSDTEFARVLGSIRNSVYEA